MEEIKKRFKEFEDSKLLFVRTFVKHIEDNTEIGEESKKATIDSFAANFIILGVNVSIYKWDTEKDIYSKCNVCDNSLNAEMSDEEIIKLIKQKKDDVKKRIEIALFILEAFQQLKD